MLPNPRQQALLDLLEERGQATVRLLSKKLYASEATIRRDLTLLEEGHYLRRTRGGALPLRDKSADPPLLFRQNRDSEEKLAVAESASRLLEDGMTLFLDSSTTAAHLIPFLEKRRGLTVLTNNLGALAPLMETRAKVLFCGGDVFNNCCTVGPRTLEFIRNYYADLCFFSCMGASRENGLADSAQEITAVKREMLARSARSVLLITRSKIDKICFSRICGCAEPVYVAADGRAAAELFREEQLL